MSTPPEPDAIWLFGYGSLIWRPDLPYRDRRAARVTGWARRFWQASWDHRGTPASPGRVVTLVEAPGATLWGVAYAIAAADWPAVHARLLHREQAGYRQLTLTAGLAAAHRVGPIVADVTATVFIGAPDRPEFVRDEPLATTAAIVRTSHGPSGANLDYLLALHGALDALGADDPDVRALVDLVTASAPTWDDLRLLLPPELRRWVLPDVTWDRDKLWTIDLPIRDVAVDELAWMLDLPWWRDGDRYFSVRPADVAADPARHPAQHARTLAADLAHPLVATTIEDRLVLLDGVHRLLKARLLGLPTVRVRILPVERIDEIRADS